MIMKCPLEFISVVIMFYDVLLFYYVALNRIQCKVSVFVCVSQFPKGSNGLIMRGKKNKITY